MRAGSLIPSPPPNKSLTQRWMQSVDFSLSSEELRSGGTTLASGTDSPLRNSGSWGRLLEGPHSGRGDVDWASLCWRVGGGGGGGGGLQDPPQHLEVVERLVLLGRVTGAVIGGVGVREAQHPQAVGRHHQVSLFGVEGRAGRRPRLHLEATQSGHDARQESRWRLTPARCRNKKRMKTQR